GFPLSVKYRRLFDLSLHKSSTVAAMRDLGWEAGGAAWSWRRQLWAWEDEMLRECRSLLSDIALQPNVTDQWLWRPDSGGGYTVRGVYNLLTFTEAQDVEATIDLIWHKHVPLKVSVVAWRLFRNRLPTKDNLMRRHIITQDSQFCVTGCGGVETAHHLFLSCPVFASLWSLISAWVGISSADPFLLQDHFVQFTHSSGGEGIHSSPVAR
ncbi:kinesin-like protein, partial [Trifolium medium]|nr:kinesin-like protein [Trifolium medium]